MAACQETNDTLLIQPSMSCTHVVECKQCCIILYYTSKEPVCPRVELIFKVIVILLIIFLGFIKSKPC